VPEEAEAVRRVWQALESRTRSASRRPDEPRGRTARGPWNRETVKDIARRGRMYLGYVVEKRGRDERLGRHEPILSKSNTGARWRPSPRGPGPGNKPAPFRSYALRGLVYCACGTRMRGEAHLQRGTEIRYYRCPTLGCHARRCPADLVEGNVMTTIATAVLPDSVIEEARSELRHRLDTPGTVTAGRQRARLQTRLEQLKKQHGWGDISDREYQTERDSIQAALAQLPDEDRIRTFDAYRAKLLALPAAIAVASPARREELCRIVVEQVVVNDREVEADRVDAAGSAVLRKTAGVPPSGFEPLISTLKGSCPRPLDDGGAARTGV
jgi:hypothetical protein